MAFSMQSVIDLARGDLNDANKIRYPDADLLKHANDGVAKAFALRSDLRFGSYATAYTDLAVGDDFPLGIEYRDAVAAFIVARAQEADDEFVTQGKAELGLKQFMSGLGVG